jgi:hypothetical protein
MGIVTTRRSKEENHAFKEADAANGREGSEECHLHCQLFSLWKA